MNKNIFKSIGAVLAGFITGLVLSVGTDFVLESFGIFPTPDQGFFITWMIVLAIIYRSIYTVIGGYVTAALAPNQPMRHAIILGIIGIIASTLGTMATWGQGLSPDWFPISLIIIALPCTWLGGKLHELCIISKNSKKEFATKE